MRNTPSTGERVGCGDGKNGSTNRGWGRPSSGLNITSIDSPPLVEQLEVKITVEN